MRFTKIPLIATLMAVALSLLIVLPTIAQTSDITDGKASTGGGAISVGVFDSIEDAQLAKLQEASGLTGGQADVYVPGGDGANLGAGTDGVHDEDDPAFLADRRVDPQDTFFRNTLYVSNDRSAFNVVLINVANDPALAGTDAESRTCVVDNPDTNDVNEREAGNARVTAVVKNNRSGHSITVELAAAATGGSDALAPDGSESPDAGDYSQAFFKVVDENATIDHDGNADTAKIGFTEHGGPTWCDDAKTREFDETPTDDTDDLTDVQLETRATAAQYAPTGFEADTVDPPPATQEIATIFAKHGDRLAVTVAGRSGQIELTVDGDGPDFSAITPEDNTVSESKRLTFSFEVRDDDSGLRHDGESVISPDGDPAEVNPDGDQNLESEPLSLDPMTAVPANGAAADIDINVATNPRSDDVMVTAAAYDDISASGTWRMAGSRAGVAYSFTASGADRTDKEGNPGGHYLYQLRARDRAGNWTWTDGDDSSDAPGNQPFVFRVDDTDPSLANARTGITWNPEMDREEVDRSYIALEFTGGGGPDALGDVDTDNITVVGHTVVGYIHPNEAPAIDRNQGPPDRANYSPTVIRYTPVEPTASRPSDRTDTAEAAAWTAATGSGAGRTGAQVNLLLLEGRWDKYDADVTNIPDTLADDVDASEPSDTIDSVTTEPEECAGDLTAIASADDVEICGQWDQYDLDLAEYTKAETARDDANDRHEADTDAYNDRKTPGTDIEGDKFAEPRSRVYIELSEDLASDATPTVLVVGGAVYDLAGNTNDAVTLDDEVEDWIAPGLTVTVTGTANDRPVANDEGSFTVDVRSDEDLGARPVVYFVSLAAALNEDEDGYDYTIDDPEQANPLTQQEDENHWAKTYKVNTPDFSDFVNELVGVVVVADDEADNSGATDGWSPDSHQEAAPPAAGDDIDPGDLDDAGLLIEVDEQFNGVAEPDKVGTVTPRSNSEGTETESANPFVKLSFTGEDGEYRVCPKADDGSDDCADDVDTVEDSHDTVTVTEITLNGEDAMGNLNRVNSNEFSLLTRDLEVDTHEVTYTAVDDAGNEYEGSFEFDVKERAPYEIEVSPGWNLISLPATPLESGIGDVLANNQYISPVLGYQEGDWITAIREEDGTWRGRLTEIVGGYGYWVHARTFESIETMLSEVDPAGTLPTVPVTAGWNLLGVLDIFQNDENEAPGETVVDETGPDVVGNAEADDYFNSIPWKVAYTYNTSHSLWVKTVPEDEDDMAGEDGEIENGNGYWVWSPTPGTLVP